MKVMAMIGHPIGRVAAAAALFAVLPAASARADAKGDLSALPPACWSTLNQVAFQRPAFKRWLASSHQIDALFASGATGQACRQLDRMTKEQAQTASTLEQCGSNPAIGHTSQVSNLMVTLSDTLAKLTTNNNQMARDKGC